MVVTRTANQPITFSGQIVAYAAGVANTYQERIITDVANTPVTFSGQITRFDSTGGNPAAYTPS